MRTELWAKRIYRVENEVERIALKPSAVDGTVDLRIYGALRGNAACVEFGDAVTDRV